jgi:predicted DNA-binding transcriptional regulator AlpA
MKEQQSDGDLLQFPDLKSEGIPYSRNWLDELIKRRLFPPGRRFVPGGRRHWTRGEVRAAKEQAARRIARTETP